MKNSPVNSENLSSGAFLISRSLFDSDIWFMPPEYMKIWLYLIGKANHSGRKYRGFFCERGQYFCDYKELRDQLKYKIGYRSKQYNENYMKNLMKHLRSTLRITTLKKPRGILVTIANYNTYQDLKSYEKTNGKPNEKTICKPHVNQKALSINKNDKELKNKRKNTSPNSDEIRLSRLLFSLIRKRSEGHTIPDMEKWATHIGRMIRLDGRNLEDIEKVILWCQENKFWQNNILSTAKLRNNYDQLKLKMESENGNGGRSNGVVL